MRRRIGGALLNVLVLVVAVVLWEAATQAAKSTFFPPPSKIVSKIHEMWLSGPASHAYLSKTAGGNIGPSLLRFAISLAICVVAGVCLGIALGRSERFRAYVDPLVQFARAIPPPALVPVFLVLFDLGTQMQLASIIFSGVWTITLNTADGARSVDQLQLDTARVFRLTSAERVLLIILPSSLPKIFAGIRLALSLSLILMVFSELLPGTANGIGFELTNAQSQFDYPAIWSVIVLLALLGYLFNTVLLMAERRVLAWHRSSRKAR